MKKFYSSGKLLITGEYLVLNGAKALAVPLKVGQTMEVLPGTSNGSLKWESYYNGEIWFKATIDRKSLTAGDVVSNHHPGYLQKLLYGVKKLNPGFLSDGNTAGIANFLDFSPDWGFGSSSTLITNLAALAEVDPFKLNQIISNGSGYDIACASSSMPILFSKQEEKRTINPVRFYPAFSENLYLVWLGNKKSSELQILWYRGKIHPTKKQMAQITNITNEIWQINDLKFFGNALEEHNSILEKVLGLPQIKKQVFNDFEGVIKPLGAWGGDFVLVVSELSDESVRSYFNQKGFQVIFNWDEIVRNEID